MFSHPKLVRMKAGIKKLRKEGSAHPFTVRVLGGLWSFFNVKLSLKVPIAVN